jgi:hypothetical protein
MNLELSIHRLPDSIKQLIVTQATVKGRYGQGERLEQILGSSEWAAEWERSADHTQVQVLRGIVIHFAGLPFEMEALVKAIGERMSITGAEIRVAVARLRRCGILYAVRKAWGDQLCYLPTDSICLWQPLLLPVRCKPISITEVRGLITSNTAYRLPLSLELFAAWFSILRHPLRITTKGALHRPSVARMTAELHLTNAELESLSLSYPQNEHIPAQAALALDIGLCCKVLRKEGSEIRISEAGLDEWLSFTPIEADIQLHEQVILRYGSAKPSTHVTASAIRSLPTMEWYPEEELRVHSEQEDEVIHQWLALLESFGWLERGLYLGQAVFRKKMEMSSLAQIERQEACSIYIQPDGEIFVPPDVSLRLRWKLEEIAEKVAADALFVYRLTRAACAKAYDAGYTLQSVIVFLEESSAMPLPKPVSRALQDWFAPLGKVSFAEVVLLRVLNSEIAETLIKDTEIAEQRLERVGDRDFIIDAACYSNLRLRLIKLGYPPIEKSLSSQRRIEDSEAVRSTSETDDQGWVYRRHLLSMYEADRTLPSKEELFPGMSTIPKTWISQPRAYHASTCKELIQRAIDWQVYVQIQKDGLPQSFIPQILQEEGSRWWVIGQWRFESQPGIERRTSSNVVIQANEIRELMIVLPPAEELESI